MDNLPTTQPLAYKSRPDSDLRVVSRDLGRLVAEEIRGVLDIFYKNHPGLRSLILNSNGTISNTNPFVKALLSPSLYKRGFRYPNFSELGKVLKYNPRSIPPITLDFALVLYSLTETYEPNKILLNDLYEQVTAQKGNVPFPILISLSGLRLNSMPGSKYDNLTFRFLKSAEIIHAPILTQPGYFSREDIDEVTSLPKITRKDRNSPDDLELLTGQQGLCRVYLSAFQDIAADQKDLGKTDYSPVLVVKK